MNQNLQNKNLPPQWLAVVAAITYILINFFMLLQIKNDYQWRVFIPNFNALVCLLCCAFVFGQKIISKLFVKFNLEKTVINYINDSLMLISIGILPVAAITRLIFH